MPDILSALNMTCDIEQAIQTTASAGDTTIGYSTIYRSIPCRWLPDTTGEGVRYQRETSRALGRFIMRPTLTVDGRSRIVFAGRTFNVQGVIRQYDDSTGLVSHLEVSVEETV
jgi:hypothetical protein